MLLTNVNRADLSKSVPEGALDQGKYLLYIFLLTKIAKITQHGILHRNKLKIISVWRKKCQDDDLVSVSRPRLLQPVNTCQDLESTSNYNIVSMPSAFFLSFFFFFIKICKNKSLFLYTFLLMYNMHVKQLGSWLNPHIL